MPAFAPRLIATLATAAGLAALAAGCSAPPPPPPPPLPPPKIVIPTPPRPLPPANAPETLAVPAVDPATGLFDSVNRNITPAQTTWNLRSAFNVAALNCMDPRHADVVVAYRAFLKTHAKKLDAANRTVDKEFKAKYGAGFIRPRELYMTSVYNHFALPPIQDKFCDAVQAVARDMATIKPAELDAFAARSLPNIEIVFDDFYRRYMAWRADLAAWNSRYAPNTSPTVAVPGVTTGPSISPAYSVSH